jgi:formylglycine-generating enzyme required for sulfatase activity
VVATGCENTLLAGSCLIAGACVGGGQAKEGDVCQICTTAKSTTAWSDATDGTNCGQGLVCLAGKCVPGTACGGVVCPVLHGYSVSCNTQAHCEYANAVTTGWTQWDVWIYVPPGSFAMGSPSTEAGHLSNEAPVHNVTFANGYLIGKFEVTVSEYEACESMSPGTCTPPSVADGPGANGLNTSANGRSNHPQNGLTWDQASAFCNWQYGRLPSEAEWEYAASGPVHRKYPWGDGPEPTCANNTANFDEAGKGCGTGGSIPEGTKTAGVSWSGALDMAGNEGEWCADGWHDTYSGAPTDGSAWVSPAGTNRVIRGGSWYGAPVALRSSSRGSVAPGDRNSTRGGRCVRDLPLTCGGITCPVIQGYKASCNAQQHCEYANMDTTGWKQWDVWVHVPAGSFTMGSPSGEVGHTTWEDPNHDVKIAKGYLMGKYEVTVLQYEACMAASPATCTALSVADSPGTNGLNTSANGRSTHPQNGLTWAQAGAVCTWLGGRRPSEAEWEYAAKGPTHRQYPWGDTPAPTCANNTAVMCEDFPCGCGTGGTMPAGSKTAGVSWCGALDMAGNVWEWVEDWFHSNYMEAPTDGSAWVSPTDSSRVIRGGTFVNGAAHLRSTTRSPAAPGALHAAGGGRCVRDLPTTCGACPAVSGYNVSCNAQQHCEYANADPTGWKAWDVWVHVPAGSFTMGSPSSEAGHDTSENPNHEVTFAKGYLMGKYEVTVSQYEACMAATPATCTAPSVDDQWPPPPNGLNTSANGRSTHPQNGLTHDQAGAVCTWLGGRRPSEAEWEYAASGPTHLKYPWGGTPEPTCANNTAVYNQLGTVAGYGCGTGGTMPAGSMTAGASWSGALDMAGNVVEWCEDWWHTTYTGAPADGSAWVSPISGSAVTRGGSFDDGRYSDEAWFPLRSSDRRSASPAIRRANIGSRCLRSLP